MEWADIVAGAISIMMVFFTISIHYEMLHLIWINSSRFRRRPHFAMYASMFIIFLTHTICVWSYAGLYWCLEHYFNFGSMGVIGVHDSSGFMNYIYFSAVTYTSVGFGDIYPKGPFRMIAGVEAINGLILIGLSVTLTYFAMERLWGYRFEWRRSKNSDHERSDD